MAKAFVPDMLRNRYGRFIAISTECVMQHLPGQSAYVAGKRDGWGLTGVSEEIGPLRSRLTRWHPVDDHRTRSEEGTQRQGAYESAVPSDAAVKTKRSPMSWPSRF
jgi:3-oxoacyl-[acyl-carrier protein] reductase